MRSRFLRLALVAVCLLSAATLALVAFIAWRTGTNTHAFLVWNLFLAWIPLLFALALEWGRRRGLGSLGQLALGVGWLLFLPNAPYIATDIVHLRDPDNQVSIWLQLSAILVAAACGALAGFLSLVLVQWAVRRRFGAAIAWVLVAATLALSSFGIYLGRIVRLNSWDVVTRPGVLAATVHERLADPLSYPRMVVGTIGVTIALLVSYAIFYRLASALDRPNRLTPGP